MSTCHFEQTGDVLYTLTCKGVCERDVHKCPAQRAGKEDEIRRWYPLFEFEFCRHLDPDRHGHHCCIIGKGHRAHFDETTFWNYHEMRTRFEQEHRRNSAKNRLMERYESLTISVRENRFGAAVSNVWVRPRRLSDGGEAHKAAAVKWPKHGIYLDDPDLHEWLELANEQADLALQDDWFYCSAHGRAEEGERYGAEITFQYCEEAAHEHGWGQGQTAMTGD